METQEQLRNLLETLDEVCEMSDAQCALMDEYFDNLSREQKLRNILG